MLMIVAASNDRLREILPLLRPRSAEPTVFSQTVFYLLLTGMALLVVLYLLRWYRQRRKRVTEFWDLGNELGLDDEEIQFVLRIGREQRMKNPRSLLTSARFFDRHVGEYATRLAMQDLHHPLLDQIADVRSALGFDDLPVAQALSSTRQVEKGQTLQVLKDEGEDSEHFTPWLVVERDEAVLSVVPLLKGDATHYTDVDVGGELSVRFWREGDTEYGFDTIVVGREGDSFLLRHCVDIKRVQQRDFFRVDVDPIDLIALPARTVDEDEAGVAGEGGHEGQRAVVLLDNESDPDGDHAAQDGETDDRETTAVAMDRDAPRLAGHVCDISAGGLSVILRGDAPAIDRWLIDPDFDGGFPLANLVCTMVGDRRSGGDTTIIKLKYDDLPATIESEIVRRVYQFQLISAGGQHPPRSGAPDPPPADAE